ncbi:DNA polymerase III subunit alpha [Candidatus Mycoplasma haematobovis]|uniref:DNA polymerase III subunit alpha n=1 Tax=Candidatus Mycoplasma haematobovis TaxID=432608 RepID=A0A1A9QCA0_9MOLU|nr:PHP domain-containing protein [Candidatus Mycoplasma haematobovis]OAL10202.1 DNA polymerase III subunit alpha [Candidatus Mycoplasma haematobovis]
MLYPHLFARSHFTFLKSTLRVEDIIDYALNNKHKYAVISDFRNTHVWISFYKKCKEARLTPIFALELNYQNSLLLLIARNKQGYQNLLHIATYDFDPSKLENLIIVHIDGEKYFSDHENFFIANSEEENGVYLRENKFLNAEDYEFFCLLRAIDNQTLLSEEIELNQHFKEDYLNKSCELSQDSIQIKNIYKILSLCKSYDIFDTSNKLDFFSDSAKDLEKLSRQGLKAYGKDKNKEYLERLENELKIVIQKGFDAYFLIVQDAVNWAKNNDICVGPGRGSVCGSLLAFLLGITEVDPLKYGLYFERFLNPEREADPDIDIDVSNNKRELLLEYLRDKYGPDHLSLIITFSTFKGKNSLREIGKAFGIVGEEADYLTENKLPTKARGFLQRIIDFPKNTSIHAAGVIISSKPLCSIIPLIPKEFNLTQWEAQNLKYFNLIKFDFLALHYLSVLDTVKKNVENSLNIKIDWENIDENDAKVYETLIKGRNAFIFQFDSYKIKGLIRKFKPNSLLDLALLSALNRPGASDQIAPLLARKFSINNPSLLPPVFDSFLNETYGLIVYQEQVMKIISLVTNSSFGYADSFRRELTSAESIQKCREIFLSPNAKYSKEDLKKTWEYISRFAKYGFNKSHALAYAIISYRLLWLKTYYPSFFYTELLSFSDSPEHFSEIEEAGFSFSYPKMRYSEMDSFVCHNNSFFFPISKITRLSLAFRERYKKNSFSSTLEALKYLVSLKISKDDLLVLIRSNFFENDEHPHYWECNLEDIYSSLLYVDVNTNKALFELNLKDVKITKEIQEQYKKYLVDYIGVDLDKYYINPKFFEKNKKIYSILRLNEQESGTCRYLSFISYLRSQKTHNEIPYLKMRFSERFYMSSVVVYYGENVEELKEALVNRHAVLVTIEKHKEFFKVTKIQVLKRNG